VNGFAIYLGIRKETSSGTRPKKKGMVSVRGRLIKRGGLARKGLSCWRIEVTTSLDTVLFREPRSPRERSERGFQLEIDKPHWNPVVESKIASATSEKSLNRRNKINSEENDWKGNPVET